MRSLFITLTFILFFSISTANAACVYKSYQEADGSLSEVVFPATDATAESLTASGYSQTPCEKAYTDQQVSAKCVRLQAWPEEMKTTFATRFSITVIKLCQYSLEAVQSQ